MRNWYRHHSLAAGSPRIIAFSGKAQSGKTTAAKFLAEAIGSTAKIFPFAEELKLMALAQFPELTEDHVYRQKNAIVDFGKNKIQVRQLLIDLGKFYRGIDADFWVKKMWTKAEAHLDGGGIVIVDDMRYLNEMAFLENKGAISIRIDRDDVVLIDDESETQLDAVDFKYRISNNAGLEELRARSVPGGQKA